MLPLLAILAGCQAGDPCDGQDGTCLSIEVQGTVVALDSIRFDLRGAVQHSFTSSLPAGVALPVQVGVLLPLDAQGIISITAVGSLGGQTVAQGTATAAVTPGAHVRAVLGLQPEADPCAGRADACRPGPVVVPPAAVWISSGGGSMAGPASQALMSLSIGGDPSAGLGTSAGGATLSTSYFGSVIY
jgi:hypothetical protein